MAFFLYSYIFLNSHAHRASKASVPRSKERKRPAPFLLYITYVPVILDNRPPVPLRSLRFGPDGRRKLLTEQPTKRAVSRTTFLESLRFVMLF